MRTQASISRCFSALLLCCFCAGIVSPQALTQDGHAPLPYLLVLGVAQDGGVPQAGSRDAAWSDAALRRTVSCLALVDPATRQRWLFDATPHFPEQLHMLDSLAPSATRPGLAGIFLTHAHIGHYTGLMHLGLEAMGAKEIPVYAMPRMAEFLRANGPWSQLVKYRNIELRALGAGRAVELTPSLRVTPLLVPHRQEFSEVAGFRIDARDGSALFIPDIDRWEQLDSMGTRIEDLIASVDVAYLDGTFYSNGEIPGRDISSFPHPMIVSSMARFAALPATERAKVRFIHLNHTNRALYPGPEQQAIEAGGFGLAREGERIELGNAVLPR